MTSPHILTTTTVLPVEHPHPEDRYITCGHDDDDTPTLILNRNLWDDLGHPRCVTLTIHPGDTLNP